MLHGRPSVFFSLVCPYTFYCHCFPCPVLPPCDRPALRPEGPLPSGTAGGSLHPKTLQGSLLYTQCKCLHVAHRSCRPRPSPALASVPWSPGGAAGRLLALHGSPFLSQAFVHAPVPLLPRLCPSFRAHLKGCLLRSCPWLSRWVGSQLPAFFVSAGPSAPRLLVVTCIVSVSPWILKFHEGRDPIFSLLTPWHLTCGGHSVNICTKEVQSTL